MAEKLPVLIAAVTAQVARELEEASRAGADVWVPLEQGPQLDGMHVLEMYTADADAPICLLAEPLGMGDERGTALRLHPSMPESEPEPPPRTSLAGGRYELISLIGQGSIGAVYRARHTGLNSLVAVKVLHESFQMDAEFSRRFYDEALAMSRLNHTNLISIHDFGQEPDGLLYIAMSIVEGLTLRQVQKRERRVFDIPRIVALMLQVCGGLGHAHGRGLIHRDVKPDNLMIVTEEDDDGHSVETVKILDFGFAVPPSVSGEVAQRLAGTPVYMSPEQCRGEELDQRSDVYACGIMMYELATGFLPFLSRDSAKLRNMHINMAVPLVASKRPDIDPRYERIVQRALSKNREERQPSMMALRAELKELLLPASTPTPQLRVEPAPASTPTPARVEAPPPSPRIAAPPPSAPRPAPAPAPAPADDWLERGTGYDITAADPGEMLANRVAKDPNGWVRELSQERNPRALARRLSELDGAVRVLAARGDAKTLVRVSAFVAGLGESVHDEAGRSALTAITRLFANPDLLGPIANNFLRKEAATDPQREAASELLSRAGLSGAVALYGARTKLLDQTEQHGRVAFVTMMKSLGASARPVLRAALERIYEQSASAGMQRGAPELTEDVLLSVPKGDDEQAGALIVKFAGAKIPGVARAAARALPRVVGIRARPVLLSLIQHDDDTVCMAAVAGLKELEIVDHDAIARIGAQVDAGRVRTQQMQKVFSATLQSVTGGARAEALAVLARMPR